MVLELKLFEKNCFHRIVVHVLNLHYPTRKRPWDQIPQNYHIRKVIINENYQIRKFLFGATVKQSHNN